jgi:hypothetical protein
MTGYAWQQGTVVADPKAHAGKALRFSPHDEYLPGLVLWGPYSELAPGDYIVTFVLKVESALETHTVCRVHAGVQEQGFRDFATRDIAPSDFSQAGEYQEFSLSFHLDRFVTGVEFRVNYNGGMAGNWASTDLYADYVVARREGGLDLPALAGIFIALVGPHQPLDDSMEITREFERRGGLVLHPDEFMAALNPEYMIEFASPRLGANHPALANARQLLNSGRYLDSLLAVRSALRSVSP